MLILCATPIGNLEDITYRAIRTLKEADYIAAEDTRHTRKLLNHFEIDTPMISYHEHNKIDKGKLILQYLKQDKTIALVTDAGTPGISDPGEDIVKLALEENIVVTAAPGAAACIVALIISGQSTRRFIFEGFLPQEKKEQNEVLEALKDETRTIIFYEAPHRLTKTLSILYEKLGDRSVTILKELTKKYETTLKFTLSEAKTYFNLNTPKGEFVLVLAGKSKALIQEENIKQWENMPLEEHLNIYLSQNIEKKEALKLVAKDRGVSKREIYNKLISLGNI
ncbi:16S rRNA (cytidine(1402)-2'-O)-methyltransferase [Candidatus Epulonipiscium fishelsonii]|uniref:16S rRNA (Cytidine(1402)-2'-O)-methyltransferase n=1 Tax=Candidatus Epulonipiscium fishelsonii TaxID=77094 RepID=A0ACC8XGB4_9FIRM|nr:16S rRNA (cytidine(1402)-2'-O)-methyltransferase [Epulopiscium sp. SCG-B05WGA-EpuloA1]ONI42708.1 16S rRNA (cytidine(1402)-2'-O)-methyltransferase [Epulopiscium sp. SCG-B11WGA-EpuloA1]ONI47032.1 16S rRNA (cytidine(1402)-2'-O)-methyltransferase [Epulopiscium sp. SCG-C06WGA-EpuloA1]